MHKNIYYIPAQKSIFEEIVTFKGILKFNTIGKVQPSPLCNKFPLYYVHVYEMLFSLKKAIENVAGEDLVRLILPMCGFN